MRIFILIFLQPPLSFFIGPGMNFQCLWTIVRELVLCFLFSYANLTTVFGLFCLRLQSRTGALQPCVRVASIFLDRACSSGCFRSSGLVDRSVMLQRAFASFRKVWRGRAPGSRCSSWIPRNATSMQWYDGNAEVIAFSGTRFYYNYYLSHQHGWFRGLKIDHGASRFVPD